MQQQIIDTNVILRFLVGDNEELYKKASQIFKEAQEGKYKIIIKSIVVAEAVFVLESYYQKSRREISDALKVFLAQKWLKVEERKILLSLWPQFEKGQHFVDCYLLASVKNEGCDLLTFDKQLSKLKARDSLSG